MIIDGRKIAEEIKSSLKEEVLRLNKKPKLAVVYVENNLASLKFIEQKEKFGREIGIEVKVFKFAENISAVRLRKQITEIVRLKKNTGVIIQLPLPATINVQYILNSVPAKKDPDMLSLESVGGLAVGQNITLPPIAGAVAEIFEKYKIDYKNKYIAIMGAGNLVGKPVALWLLNQKAAFSVIRSATKNPEEFTKKADIIISGVGKPKFITGNMVKNGAVIIDCGTSVETAPVSSLSYAADSSEHKQPPISKLVGDVDFDSVNLKASHITPVPGGIGPITVAMLFKNLVRNCGIV